MEASTSTARRPLTRTILKEIVCTFKASHTVLQGDVTLVLAFKIDTDSLALYRRTIGNPPFVSKNGCEPIRQYEKGERLFLEEQLSKGWFKMADE
jgi:hypothetical protein